ncbi:DedA family protein [Paracoccus nototheniae]|uniref:DedA family protein n=1 Tax=Paracoccus nototheniae TaxID=2489002 RepID=A0ABW4E033_9RHOB|nr:VTT domain-containing protein [Paracoccus nototheniae]
MSADLAAALPLWGPWLLAVCAFLSCMMVPVPTSVLLISAGALTGTGHLEWAAIWLGAVTGASLGDLTAFLLARRLQPWLARRGRLAVVLGRAQALIARRGVMAVFLSRWLVTPLGPATNYVAGAAGLSLPRFLAASVPGEMLWAALHLGAGHLAGRGFRGEEAAAQKALAVAAALGLGVWGARRLWHKRQGGAI